MLKRCVTYSRSMIGSGGEHSPRDRAAAARAGSDRLRANRPTRATLLRAEADGRSLSWSFGLARAAVGSRSPRPLS
jgi:hypothetical protein